MNNGQDKIPSWVGRAVTTADVPAGFDGPIEQLGPSPAVDTPSDRASATTVGAGMEAPSESENGGSGQVDDFDSTSYRAPSPEPVEAPSPHSSANRRLLVTLGLVAAVIVLAVVALNVLSDNDRSSSNDVSATETEADEEAGSADPPPSEAVPAESRAELVVEADDQAESDGDTDADPAGPAGLADLAIPGISPAVIEAHRAEAWAAGEPAWAVYRDGKIYLQGQVPDDQSAELLIERLESILGPENVVAQFTVDPASPPPTDPPLFIKETVVFAPQSTTMPPGSDWILIIADVLMKRFPSTSLTVVADGSAPSDPGDEPDLVDQRVDAIISYLTSRGLDASRLGSRVSDQDLGGPVAGTKPIEFVVRGLLGEEG